MGIIAITALLLPFALLVDLFRLGRGAARLARRHPSNVPLPQKNKRRATGGAFVLVACAVLAAHGFPVIGWQATAGLAGFALLYLVVGIHGAARRDLRFYAGVLVGRAGTRLHRPAGVRQDGRISAVMTWLLDLGCIGLVVAAVLRIVLIVRPPAGAQLPHPSKFAGMPMAGPASMPAAHAAINRKKS